MLPAEAVDIVERTVAATGLSGRERDRVRAELECHFLDGIDAGVPVRELILRFGDPLLAAALIRRSRSPIRRTLARSVLLATAAAAACYLFAFMRLETADGGTPQSAFEAEATHVRDKVAEARLHLEAADGVWAAYGIAAELRRRRSLWAETASILLLGRAVEAAEAQLSHGERQSLRDSLAVLAATETLSPRHEILERGIEQLSHRIRGRDGRIGRAGLALLRQVKGGESLSVTGRLLEPLYFASSLSQAETRELVRAYVTLESRRASSVGSVLGVRLRL